MTPSVLVRWWIGLAALYLLLAWSVAPAELVVAVMAASCSGSSRTSSRWRAHCRRGVAGGSSARRP